MFHFFNQGIAMFSISSTKGSQCFHFFNQGIAMFSKGPLSTQSEKKLRIREYRRTCTRQPVGQRLASTQDVTVRKKPIAIDDSAAHIGERSCA